jgi:hypothetical protein
MRGGTGFARGMGRGRRGEAIAAAMMMEAMRQKL